MPWHKWNVIVVLILMNYVVFGILAALVFPVKPPAPLLRTAQPTFTPGTKAPQRVGTLSYDFLTPSPTARATNTSTRTPIAPTVTETATTSPEATTMPSVAPTLASPALPTATSASMAPTGTSTAPVLLAPRPLITTTTTRVP